MFETWTWLNWLIGFIGISVFVDLIIAKEKYSFWRRFFIFMSLWTGVYFTAWYVLAQYGVRK
jgi:hypothetical protein